MKLWWVLPLIVGLFVVGLTFTRVLGHPRPAPVSCGTGSDLTSRSCREAEDGCRDDPGIGGGSADGDGFSYTWTCRDGTLTSFRYG